MLAAVREYLEAQVELGEAEVFFEEPWLLSSLKPAQRAAAAAAPRPLQAAPRRFEASAPSQGSKVMIQSSDGRASHLDLNAVKAAERNVSRAFLSAATLDEFYEKLSAHVFYGAAKVVRGEGTPNSPEVLLVLDAPITADFASGAFLASPTGAMLLKMFEALNIPREGCFASFVYKRIAPRTLSPMMYPQLRQMFEKEVSLVAPKRIALFGEQALKILFGRASSLSDMAGRRLDFAGVPCVSLHDARAMLGNKPLKLETWKVHIPNCGMFKQA